MKSTLFLSLWIFCSCGIERPNFELIQQTGGLEVRQYAAIPVVSTPLENMGKRNDSFRALFRYISGENLEKMRIAMTAPVFIQSEAAENEQSRMSFMIPAKVSAKGAPTPYTEMVVVSKIGGGTFAVLRFKGWRDDVKREEAAAALGELLFVYGLKPVGQPFYAIYDPPWIPEWFRRNEVWQRVEL